MSSTFLIVIYCIIATLPLLYWYFTRNFNYWSKRGIKGPKPVVGFGNILSQFITPKPYLTLEWQQKYGKIFGIYSGNKPLLVLSEPELIKQICVKDFHIFTDRNRNRRNHPILSKHLVAESGDDWKRIRSIVTPTFTSGKMKKMYPKIRQCLNEFLDVLTNYANNKSDVNIKDMFGNYTMDVIATCAFATKTNSHKDPNNPFIINAQKVFAPKILKLIALLIFPKILLNLLNIKHPADESANQFFFSLTRHIIKERKSSDKKHNDFIQLLLNAEKNYINNETTDENDNNVNESHHVNEGEEERAVEKKTLSEVERYITEDEILANSWVFFVAGYETTATTLTFCSYELALNLEIQEKLYSEIMTVVDSNGEIDYDLLAKLPYLDAVISETLRLHSPALILVRQASEDYKLGDTGITILRGQQIEIPIFAVHRSEEFYENALKFNPDRFLPENRHKIKPYSYIPFGAGPRSCVGMRFALMEAKLALVQVIQKFRFFSSSQTDIPLVLNKSIILHSPKRVIIGIENRN